MKEVSWERAALNICRKQRRCGNIARAGWLIKANVLLNKPNFDGGLMSNWRCSKGLWKVASRKFVLKQKKIYLAQTYFYSD